MSNPPFGTTMHDIFLWPYDMHCFSPLWLCGYQQAPLKCSLVPNSGRLKEPVRRLLSWEDMARAQVSGFFLSCANFGVSGWLLYATESGVEAPQEVIRRWPQAGGCITRVSLKTEVNFLKYFCLTWVQSLPGLVSKWSNHWCFGNLIGVTLVDKDTCNQSLMMLLLLLKMMLRKALVIA